MMAEEKRHFKNEDKRATSIIRIAGRDIDGKLKIEDALRRIKGIGSAMAHAMAFTADKKLSIPPTSEIGALNEKQIAQIEGLIKEPSKYAIPQFMLNRRKDFETGKDAHVVGNDLIFSVRQDITRGASLRTLVGSRHQHGQKVRGQHTRSTGRTGATVGVMKKAAKAGAAPKAEDKKK
jgi:small subunit ribosomal protein S13